MTSFAAAGATDALRQITAVSGLDTSVLAVCAVFAAALLIFSIRALDPLLPFKTRAAAATLRTLIIATCLLLLIQPTLHIRTIKSHPASVAVLADTSFSMQRGETTRLAMAVDMLKNSTEALDKLQKNRTVRFWKFSDSLYPAAGIDGLLEPNTPGAKTDIRRAITQLVETGGEHSIQGVILISDGADTEMSAPDGRTRQMSWVAKLGVPVNTVLIKDAPTRTDLSILGVEAAPFAFLRSDTPIAVTLGAVGIPDKEVEAFLKRDGAVLQRRTARLVGGKARLTFNILPFKLGRRVYEIVVPAPSQDEVPDNNRRFLSIDVVRDKYRILHLAGRPSWDQRFLRDTLSAWPRVDLVSFYVLRTAYQSAADGSSGMALIPFPTEELFNDHLGEFDVIIFQEFDPTEVEVDAYGEKIANFVKNGGALAIIGGAKGLLSGTFGDKSLEEILPVKLLPPNTPTARQIDRAPFRAKLTEEGRRHPLTRLKKNREENKQMWRSMTALDGVGRVARLQKGAHALLEHPGLFVDDGPHPLLAVMEAGKGRTLSVTTDSLWRWRFSGPMTGGPGNLYAEFWHKIISWLTRSPDLDRLRLSVTPAPVTLGRAASIGVELLDEIYRPAAGENIQIAVSPTADQADAAETFSATTDSRGMYRMDWKPKKQGAYKVRVTAGNGLENTISFLAISGNREQNRLDPDESLLKALSEASGGHFDINRLNVNKLVINPATGKEVIEQSALPLWDRPITLIWLLLLLAAEWLLRKRSGLD